MSLSIELIRKSISQNYFPLLFNFSDITAMKRNLALMQSSIAKSFCYATKSDFITAFGADETVLVAKDYRFMKFNFESNHPDESDDIPPAVLLRDVQISGSVVRPVQFKLVNSDGRQTYSNLLLCLDSMESEDETKVKPTNIATIRKPKQHSTARSLNVNLFRRRMKAKKFLELESNDREHLAKVTLLDNRYKDKSLFYYVDRKQLVHQSDYDDPDFVSVSPPNDTEYEDSYSNTAPSVYDLFDIPVNPLPTTEDYEMLEYLDEDEEL